ncbi:MAG: SprT-like domain-containing protein [Calditrichaeota bacterium]|nr:SprT-like domain-containing protein [Calditrichota bacterium]MCB9391488.1 SprT-like domain-containing protein [Calditrichota bacterium]
MGVVGRTRPVPDPHQFELFGLVAEPVIPAAEPEPTQFTSRRGPKHKPQGLVYDLQSCFDVINEVMFKRELRQPVIRWSRNRWRYTLGLCDVEKRVITINSALDDARIPEMVVAGVMHHEMLHLYFGITEGPNGGRRFHTPEFRAAERLFPAYVTVEDWLRDNWPLRGRPARKPRPSTGGFLSYLSMMHGGVSTAAAE